MKRYYEGDANSSVNQEIKRKFVGIHVFACVTSMVEYILGKSYEDRDAPFSTDDVTNYYSYPEWSERVVGEHLYFEGGTDDEFEAFKENFSRLEEESQDLLDAEEISEETHERNVAQINKAKEKFEELEFKPQEVYEWWLVSEFLCRQLKANGECVLDDEEIWGRCATGQAILLDGTISRICAEMEILEGQANCWANKDGRVL